jgi:hypothetical protein
MKKSWILGAIFPKECRYGIVDTHPPGILCRPLTLSIFALEQEIAPDNPGFFHAVNVLLYGLTCLQLWVTWRSILVGYDVWFPFELKIMKQTGLFRFRRAGNYFYNFFVDNPMGGGLFL